MCIIRFKWREVPVPVVREEKGRGGWLGGLHLYKKCGIYTIPDWHLYNTRLAFIQFHTGIYRTTHWHLYNNTLAFIQVMSLLCFLPNSSWHSAMNGMHNLNACCPWQSAAQFFFFLPKLFMALCHEWHAQSKCMPSMAECCSIFLFPSQTLHGTLP